jgi:hypothetical protein
MLPVHLKRYKQALKRGVKIQILTDKPEGESLPKSIEAVVTNPLFEIIRVPRLTGSFAIVDDKIVFIGTGTENFGFGRALITDNPEIVAIMRDYFEMVRDKSVGSTH